MFFVLKALRELYLEDREKYWSVHRITKETQSRANKTLRDADVKVCLSTLRRMEKIEMVSVGEKDVYRLGSEGLDWYQRHVLPVAPVFFFSPE
jgi:hypothetical protein